MTKVATPADLGSSRTLDKPGEVQRWDRICIYISLENADPKDKCTLRNNPGMWVLQARFLSRNSLSGWRKAHTFMAVRHPPLLARLDVCHPQVVVVNEGEEGWVSRADFGIHPWPRALSLDLQRLHWRHLWQETDTQSWVPHQLPALQRKSLNQR